MQKMQICKKTAKTAESVEKPRKIFSKKICVATSLDEKIANCKQFHCSINMHSSKRCNAYIFENANVTT